MTAELSAGFGDRKERPVSKITKTTLDAIRKAASPISTFFFVKTFPPSLRAFIKIVCKSLDEEVCVAVYKLVLTTVGF